ncbi:hypothetical protein ACFY1P_27845 [Streptomyces sp. NPDC001407]|uniref:hypothetical protein n=1 Tax=Streptomyces sp. NPDC001407 TaxID=3364573 RepID=UPI00369A2FDC
MTVFSQPERGRYSDTHIADFGNTVTLPGLGISLATERLKKLRPLNSGNPPLLSPHATGPTDTDANPADGASGRPLHHRDDRER